MRALRRFLLILALVFGISVLLFTSSEAEFSAPAPTPDSLTVVKQALGGFSDRRSATEPFTVTLGNKELDAASSLAGHALSPMIVSSALTKEEWTAGLSRPLPFGRWLNVQASLPTQDYVGAADTLPPVRLKVGVVRFPVWLSRWIAEIAIKYMRYREPDLPAPEKVLRSLDFSKDQVTVTMQVPRMGDIYRRATGFAGTPVDEALVKSTLCYLTSSQRANPSTDFSEQVRRAFSAPVNGAAADASNRAALVSLALFVGGDRAQRLFYTPAIKDNACPIPTDKEIMIADRADLPKHWSISAALGATVGTGMTGAIGEWKELADSLPDGTGFSFVDMTANRSGFRYGRAASATETAATTRQRLIHVTADQLIPQQAFSNVEGLSDVKFDKDYSDLDSQRYKMALEMIDTQLTKAGVPQ